MVKYVLFIIFILFLAVIYKKYDLKQDFDKLQEYDLIQKYFFNDKMNISKISTNKDIIWVYIDNNKNARKWLSFYSRNSTNMNCPYILSCIESIINKCGNSFKIILVDSNSFKKLLPNWNVDMDLISGVVKENVINLGLMKILYKYGGLKIPSSTVAIQDLKGIYKKGIAKNGCFCVQEINRSLYNEFENFVPGLNIVGCKKNNIVIKDLILFYENMLRTNNTDSIKINGLIHEKLTRYCDDAKMNLLNGKFFGIKDKNGKPTDIHLLMSNTYIDFKNDMKCLYVPHNDLMKINKYGWFLTLSQKDLRECKNIICKHLLLGEC